MGCLSVYTKGCNARAKAKVTSGNTTAWGSLCAQKAVTAHAGLLVFDIGASSYPVIADMCTRMEPENGKPAASFWLVCSVSLDRDAELLVLEGNVITIDGKYMFVLKT